MKRFVARGIILGLVTLVVWDAFTHWLAWRFAAGDWPVPQGTPWTYQLESGFIPALTVVGLYTLIVGAWHHLNCHEDRCWSIGKHKVDGTPYCTAHAEAARERASQQVTLARISGQLDEIITLLKPVS